MSLTDPVNGHVFDGYATLGNDAPLRGLEYWADIKPTYDPERAKSLLQAAGKLDLALPIETSPVYPGMVEAATLWSAQAAAIGLKVPVSTQPVATYYTTAAGYTKNSRLFSVNLWFNQASLTAFWLQTAGPDASFSETGWGLADPNQNRLMYDAVAELDPAKATEKRHAFQLQQVQEGGYIVPANPNYVDAYALNVRGGNTSAVGNNSLYDYHKIWLG